MISVPPMGAAQSRAPLSSLSYLALVALAATLLVGCGASGMLTQIESEPDITIKNVELQPTGSVSYNSSWSTQGRSTFGGVQPLPDSRTMMVFPEDVDDDHTTISLKMFGPALNELWSVQRILGPTIGIIGVSAENDKAHMLAVKYDEDADIDSVRLVRYSFASADGRYLTCDTIARARGVLEVDNDADSGFMAYRVLRSPDSSKILVYQPNYQYEHNVTKRTINVLVLDRSCNIIYTRTVDCPVSSYEIEPDPDDWEGQNILGFPPIVDNNGGFYVVSLEAGKTLRASYYADRDGVARTGTYKLDEAAFKRFFEDDVEDMTFSVLVTRALEDRLLLSTNVVEEGKHMGQMYGFVSLEFPRETMTPKVRVLHPFSEEFAEKLADDDEADGMTLVATVPFADGSLAAFFDHAEYETKTVGKGLSARTISIAKVDRFGVIHYGADGKMKWVGSVDDDYYGSAAQEVGTLDLAMREIARDDHTVDIVFNYQDDNELRTFSFDAARDTLTIGRSIAGLDGGQLILRPFFYWSTPSRLLVVAPEISFGSTGIVLNLVETNNGKPLFAPRKLDD